MIFVIEDHVDKFRMSRENAVELGFDFGSIVSTRELFADRSQHVGCFVPGFFLSDSQNVGEVALDGSFDGFVTLNVMQVRDTKEQQ